MGCHETWSWQFKITHHNHNHYPWDTIAEKLQFQQFTVDYIEVSLYHFRNRVNSLKFPNYFLDMNVLDVLKVNWNVIKPKLLFFDKVILP